MKIAITTSGDGLDSQVDPRFGRAKAFIIYDTESGEWSLLDNAQKIGADTIDATPSVTAIHQDHGYEHIPAKHGSPEWHANPEIARNLELAGYCVVGTNHVDWELGERLVRR